MVSKQSKKLKNETVKKRPIKKKRAKSTKDKKAHYVNAKDFYDQIKEFYKTEYMPDVLAESINKIAIGLSYAPNFINYSYKDDMVGDAILKMFSALQNKKFNCDTGNNPFSYFTTIAFHAFINRIKKEKKHRETLTRYQETIYNDLMLDQSVPASSDDPFPNDDI
jgi:hypothetical protein